MAKKIDTQKKYVKIDSEVSELKKNSSQVGRDEWVTDRGNLLLRQYYQRFDYGIMQVVWAHPDYALVSFI